MCCSTVVGGFINIMKTTFDFDLYKAVKQHGYTSDETSKQRQAVN